MGLFKKFTVGSGAEPSGQQDIHEIIDNLNSILNTKKDYGAPLGNLGIEDLNHYSSKGDIARVIIDEILYNVETFEPRLQVVSIEQKENDNPMYLSFRLQCRLLDKAQEMDVVFDSFYNFFTLDRVSKD